ncbi:MAG: ABC transporter ATP-binding protein [Candidatus Jordarchaeaceae archaeon]
MLSINDLYVYRGELQVIRGLSLKVNKGEIVAILGPNSAGKTTLLEAVIGTIKPRKGSIYFMNRNITELNPSRRIAMGMGCVLGREFLFQGMTVEENIELGAYSCSDKTSRRENVKLVYSFFPQLDALRKKKVKDLSGGEQQMVAIGRVLAAKPSFLMFDEPSSGLAPKVVSILFEAIAKMKKEGTTILLVEQNVAQALKLADRAYILESGSIVTESEAKLLLKDDRIRRAYLGI